MTERKTDHEWVKTFHSNFDRLLALLEKLLEKRQPPAYGDELLTDKEVAYLLKVSRRTLQDYRNNGILPYTQVGGKILYRASDIERTLIKGYKETYRNRKCHQLRHEAISSKLSLLVRFERHHSDNSFSLWQVELRLQAPYQGNLLQRIGQCQQKLDEHGIRPTHRGWQILYLII